MPLKGRTVLFAQLAPSLLDRGHDMRANLRVGQLPGPVLRPDLGIPSADRGLLQGDMAVASTELFHELPFLGCQDFGLVRFNRGGHPSFDHRWPSAQVFPDQKPLVLVAAHQATLQSRQPSPYLRHVNRVPGCLREYM